MTIGQLVPEQLSLFTQDIPHQPYCSNILEYGLDILPAKLALEQRYIQFNPPCKVKWLVSDLDYVWAGARPANVENGSANDISSAPSIVNWPLRIMDQLDAGEHGASGAEGFELEHRPGHPLDGAVNLFDDVVEIFDLANQDR